MTALRAWLTAWHTRRVDRVFGDGAIAPGSARRLRAHLADCERCQRRYHRQLLAEAALPDGEARAADRLWREVRVVARDRAALDRPWWIPGAFALAGIAVLLVIRARPAPEAFLPRGSTDVTAAPPALHVFRAVTGSAAEPLPDHVRSGDGLLFAYSNPTRAYSYLMVFAVDEQRRVYWYYPAYQRPGDDPEAIPIEAGREGVELNEVIRQPLPAGRVRLVSLFLSRPLRVLAVEAAVAAGELRPATLGVPDVREESRELEVVP